MEDLIKREDAIKAIFSKPACHGSDGSWYHSDDIRDAINSTPSADRPQGEWICEMTKSQDQARDRWVIERVVLYCSECKREAVKMTKFCPNCGCRMEMEGVDNETL